MIKFSLSVNGQSHSIEAASDTPLIYVLRNQLNLTGTKLGCGLEQCGACAVLVDGKRTLSCTRAASEFEGKEIVTIEGLASSDRLTPLQQVFVEEDAAQCGYCSAGMVISCQALLNENPAPTREEINAALNDNLCRCGSHGRVLKAIDQLTRNKS